MDRATRMVEFSVISQITRTVEVVRVIELAKQAAPIIAKILGSTVGESRAMNSPYSLPKSPPITKEGKNIPLGIGQEEKRRVIRYLDTRVINSSTNKESCLSKPDTSSELRCLSLKSAIRNFLAGIKEVLRL